MVLETTHKRKTLAVLGLVSFVVVFCFGVAIKGAVVNHEEGAEPSADSDVIGQTDDEMENSDAETTAKVVDFQAIIDNWVKSVGGEKGVAIYDLDLQKIVGEYNANKKFATASLYKLFVVYEGYRLVENGAWDPSSKVGKTGYNISECLDLAIRESHSPCAETLWSMIGRDKLDATLKEDYNLDLSVGDLSATPYETMEMLKIYYQHNEITDDALVTAMKDSFLNQPKTTYNWRQGLPSGFSNDVLVYNKVGWNWDGKKWTIYNDAAILDFTKYNRHFIVVVMTSGVSYTSIRKLATAIEQQLISTEEL